MANENDQHQVNPAAFYSDDDLKMIWSIGYDIQSEARATGQLRGSAVGAGWLYSGAEVHRYFNLLDEQAGQKNDPQSTIRQAAGRRAAALPPTSNSSYPSGATMLSSNPASQTERDARTIAIFSNAVRLEMQSGCSRREAVKRVAQKNPGSHREYLKATNRDRPVANTI